MVDNNRGSQNQVLGTLSTLSSVPNDETLYVHKASSSPIMATSRTKRRRARFVLLAGVPPFRGLRGTCRRASPPPLQASHWTYTSPKDEQLRLDATEMGVGSSRVRAPLQMTRGRCARVHEYVAKRHRSTYALPRSHRCGAQVRAGANWEHGSWNSVPQCQNSGTNGIC